MTRKHKPDHICRVCGKPCYGKECMECSRKGHRCSLSRSRQSMKQYYRKKRENAKEEILQEVLQTN